MKMLMTLLTLTTVLFAGTAYARPCPTGSKPKIIKGLEKLGTEDALFALTLIENTNVKKIKCDYQAGFFGANYGLLTPTHRIFINFVGKDISTLELIRLRFN